VLSRRRRRAPRWKKELVAIADGYRESTASWALLRDLRHRGMRAPVVAVGDGALRFFVALRDVFPETKKQRSWYTRSPTSPTRYRSLSSHSRSTCSSRSARPRIASTRSKLGRPSTPVPPEVAESCRQALRRLRGAARLLRLPGRALAAPENLEPIESTFATVRLRTKVTKGLESRAAGLAMAFKLIEAAEDRWRYVDGSHLVALVRAGATFRKGVLVESEMQDREDVA